MKLRSALLSAGVLFAGLGTADAGPINFSTFVSAGAINAVEGQNSTIGFTYAGDKFVGSVYSGINNTQLYSTDLNGGNVQKFGTPMPTGGGEVVLAGALGLGGFTAGDIYASPDNKIYKYAGSGGAPSLFATVPDNGTVRFLLFDPGNTFGGDLIASTNQGHIYRINSAGTATLLATTGFDTEGLDIIPLSAASIWGSYAGDLIASSEGSSLLYFVTPGGAVSTAPGVSIGTFESINFIPETFSGDPVEGYYAANYPVDIQKADASQFATYGGDLLATSEFGSNSPLTIIHYDKNTGLFTMSAGGNLPNQAEDGIFVTQQRIVDTRGGDGSVPEPASLLLLGTGLALAAVRQRRKARR